VRTTGRSIEELFELGNSLAGITAGEASERMIEALAKGLARPTPRKPTPQPARRPTPPPPWPASGNDFY